MARARRRPVGETQQRYERLGAEIERARIERGLTQKQLGDAIQDAQTTISDYESGKTRVPLDAVGAIEDALQLPRGTLLIDSDHVRPAETSTATAIKRDLDLDDEGRELVLSLYHFCVGRADRRQTAEPEPASVTKLLPPLPDDWRDLVPDMDDDVEAFIWGKKRVPEDYRRQRIWEMRRDDPARAQPTEPNRLDAQADS